MEKFSLSTFIQETMNVPLVLYAGTKYRKNNNSPSYKLAWSSVFTSLVSPDFIFNFSDNESRRPIFYESPQANIKLSKIKLPVVYINGQLSEQELKDQSFSEQESRKNNQRKYITSIPLLLEGSFGALVISNYDEANQFEALPEIIYHALSNEVSVKTYFFGATDNLLENPYFADLNKRGKVIFIPESLDEILINYYGDGVLPESDFTDYEKDKDKFETFYIREKKVRIDKEKLLDCTGFATLLTDEVLYKESVGNSMSLEWFYSFLQNSPYTPQWYGHLNRRFTFKRNFEKELFDKTDDQLKKRGLYEKQKVILLSGQTCSGKSIALTNLIVSIYLNKIYPVIYIKNSRALLNEENIDSLDILLQYLEDMGACSILLVCDASIYNCHKDHLLRDLLNNLLSKGRKIVLAGSTQQKCTLNDYDNINIKIELLEEERQRLIKLLVKSGEVDEAVATNWMTNTEDKNLLSLLYKFLAALHPELQKGVYNEVSQGVKAMRETLSTLPVELPDMKPELSEIARQFIKFGLISLTDNTKKTDNEIDKIFDDFVACIAVASSFRLNMPMTLALRMLNTNINSRDLNAKKLIFSATWLAYHEPESIDEFSISSVSFRTPVEAKLYLKENGINEAISVELLCTMLDKLAESKLLYFNDEVKFVARLIQMLGPNSDYENVQQNLNYKKCYPRIIEKLQSFRQNVSESEPDLIMQEVVLLREYYTHPCTDALPEQRADSLINAMKISGEIIGNSTITNKYRGDGYIYSLIVEYAICICELHKLINTHSELEKYLDFSRLGLFEYENIAQKLKSVIAARPNDSYAYNAFFKLVESEYRRVADSGKKIAILNDGIELLDAAESMGQSVTGSRYFQEPACVLKSLVSEDALDAYLDEIIQSGNPNGIYIRCYKILNDAGVSLSSSSENINKTKETLEKVIKLINDYKDICIGHSGCQYLLLRLKWLIYNGEIFLPGTEYNKTRMTNDNWEEILTKCEYFRDRFLAGNSVILPSAKIYYLLALSYAQTSRYGDAKKIFDLLDDLRNKKGIASFGQERMKNWYLVCDEKGIPKNFQGILRPDRFKKDQNNGKVYIPEIRQDIFYFLPNLRIGSPSGAFNDLLLAVGYRGFSLCRGMDKI